MATKGGGISSGSYRMFSFTWAAVNSYTSTKVASGKCRHGGPGPTVPRNFADRNVVVAGEATVRFTIIPPHDGLLKGWRGNDVSVLVSVFAEAPVGWKWWATNDMMTGRLTGGGL